MTAAVLALLAIVGAQGGVTQRLVTLTAPIVWPSQPPAGCPFQRSRDIAGLLFTGRHAEYANADTWYPSWAADGNMYSPWTDGTVNGITSSSAGAKATTGQAKIVGDDPMNLRIEDAATYASSPSPYGGRYPCGSLVYNGVWYYGTYCLMDEPGGGGGSAQTAIGPVNWGVLGPFVGFRWSTDIGKTWHQPPCTPSKPLFPEPARVGGAVKIGSPHFVDFGRNLRYSPDGMAYLVAHGASMPDPKPRIANASWITGDQIYLLRVKPSIATMNDRAAYEFFAGHDKRGRPIWTHDFAAMKPLIDWNNHCGCVTATYDPGLRKYLMCVTDGWPTVRTFDTYILEADELTGPWRLVVYMREFGQEAYFVNFPSKFISRDGRTLWMCYAANFANGWVMRLKSDPPGGRYGMCLHEVRMLRAQDRPVKLPPNPLAAPGDLAREATVTVSSTYPGYSAAGAIDGVAGGFPGDIHQEWASKGEGVGAWLRLTWKEPRTVARVLLVDRPNSLDQVTSGELRFSDGTKVEVGALPDDGGAAREVTFPARKVSWVEFRVTGVKKGSPNIGLSEIAVYGDR